MNGEQKVHVSTTITVVVSVEKVVVDACVAFFVNDAIKCLVMQLMTQNDFVKE
jgi:hypothetical protein